MNIFNLPIYYINFTKNVKLENEFKTLGFNNINHFKSIDGRKLKPLELLHKKLITIRTYRDLINTRTQHEGIPSLGAVGCTMSHNELWKLCIEKNYPYIIICENDVKLNKQILKKENLISINNILKKDNSIFISTNINKYINKIQFHGTHFYIISKGACKELVKDTFPIDIQTDYYMAHKHSIKKINIEGLQLFRQKIHKSDIQDVCVKCITPDKNEMYYFILSLLLIMSLPNIYLRFSRRIILLILLFILFSFIFSSNLHVKFLPLFS